MTHAVTHHKHECFVSIMLTASVCMPMYDMQRGVAVLRTCKARCTREAVD